MESYRKISLSQVTLNKKTRGRINKASYIHDMYGAIDIYQCYCTPRKKEVISLDKYIYHNKRNIVIKKNKRKIMVNYF